MTLCYFLFHQVFCVSYLPTDIVCPPCVIATNRTLELLVTITTTSDELAIYREGFTATTDSRPGRLNLDLHICTPSTRHCRCIRAYRRSAIPDRRDVWKRPRTLRQSHTILGIRRRMRTSLYILSKADGAKEGWHEHRLQEAANKDL